MKFLTVIKIFIILLLVMLMVFFVFENLEPVTVWIPLFKGRHFGLIYIILASYVWGIANTLWMVTYIGSQRKKILKSKVIPEGEQSLFEDEE